MTEYNVVRLKAAAHQMYQVEAIRSIFEQSTGFKTENWSKHIYKDCFMWWAIGYYVALDNAVSQIPESSAQFRLMGGEMTPQELRSVKAFLNAVKHRVQSLSTTVLPEINNG